MMEGCIFEMIDVADLGDRHYDPFVHKVESRDAVLRGLLRRAGDTWGFISKRKSYCKTLPAASMLLLDGWTLHRAERTEDAAVARIGTQQGLTIAAFVEKLASVRRHGFLFSGSAVRTAEDGFKNNGIHKCRHIRL